MFNYLFLWYRDILFLIAGVMIGWNSYAQGDDGRPMLYSYGAAFVNLENPGIETPPLSSLRDFKQTEPQGSLFRVMNVQRNWYSSTLSKSFTYEVNAIRRMAKGTSPQSKNKEWTQYEVRIKKPDASYLETMVVGSSDVLESPYWLSTDIKVVLVCIHKNRSADFYVFDDSTGKMIRKITVDKSGEEFSYIKHSNRELYFQRRDKANAYFMSIIDLDSGKITDTAPMAYPIKDILWNAEQRYYAWVGLVREPSLRIVVAMPGTILQLPLPKEYTSGDDDFERKRIVAWHDYATRNFWIAVYHPFSTGAELYKYDGEGNCQRLDVAQPNVSHSEYYNQVYLSQYKNRIILEGDESYSRYVQLFDASSSKRLFSTLPSEDDGLAGKDIQIVITNYLFGRKQYITTIDRDEIEYELDLVGGKKPTKAVQKLTDSQKAELLRMMEDFPLSSLKDKYIKTKVQDGTVMDFEFTMGDVHRKVAIANVYQPQLGSLVAWVVKVLGQDYIWYDEKRVPWKE
jgi:hypothetical protein